MAGTDGLVWELDRVDQEWEELVAIDKTLFGFLVVESAQAGTELDDDSQKKREYRKTFCNFAARLVAQMTR